MKYPCLVPKKLCKTDITISIETEEINAYGEPVMALEFTGKCNYQDKAKKILTPEKKVVEITGTALIPGDICPKLPTISGGEAVVFGVKRRIQRGTKARNPDGSVNFTEVLLI